MRVCVVGGGLAGALLAWRLASGGRTERVDLVCGRAGSGDATAASAGGVRAFEPSADSCRLATDSLRELRDSAVLQRWSGFRPGVFTYLRRLTDGGREELSARVAGIERILPGSARLCPPGDLPGWAALPDDVPSLAVVERHAGHIHPDRLRAALREDLRVRPAVAVHRGPVTRLRRAPAGGLRFDPPAGAGPYRRREYDVVVLAAGAWTPALLGRWGLADGALQTKTIQYGVHPAGGDCPTGFVDEVTGLYGRPTAEGELLLGLPTDRWAVPPGAAPWDSELQQRAVAVAHARFPRLRLDPARTRVAAVDCYGPTPGLALRPVPGGDGRLYTFTAGSGGSAKTALAASARAAGELASAAAAPSSDLAPTAGTGGLSAGSPAASRMKE